MMNPNNNKYYGKYYKVIDKKSKQVVACGKVIFLKEETKYYKNQPILISFDNKFFYIGDGTDRYECILSQNSLEFHQNIPSNYIIKPYRKFKNPPYTADIYRDGGIDELDEPVKALVYALNKLDGIRTCGSCCGHFSDKLWVDLFITDCCGLNILKLIMKDFKEYFSLRVKQKKTDTRLMMMEIKSYKTGYTAYRHASKLAKYIEERVAIF